MNAGAINADNKLTFSNIPAIIVRRATPIITNTTNAATFYSGTGGTALGQGLYSCESQNANAMSHGAACPEIFTK